MSQRANTKISRTIGFLVAITSLLPLSSAQADLAWNDHFTDEEAIDSTTTLTTPDNGLSFTTAVNEEQYRVISTAFSSNDIFTYEGAGSSGGQTQYLEISFEQNSNTRRMTFLQLSMDFDSGCPEPFVSPLWILMSVPDSGLLGSLTCSPEFVRSGRSVCKRHQRAGHSRLFYVGSRQRNGQTKAQQLALGVTGEVDGTSTDGNVVLDFGSLEVDSVSITYRSSANAEDGPSGSGDWNQQIWSFETVGISVPEPGALRCC